MTQLLVALSTAAAVVWLFSPPRPQRRDADARAEVEAPRIEIREIQVDPSPEPETEPEPSPVRPPPSASPPAPSRAEASPRRASPEESARGAELMRTGAFPRLRATYDRIGFADYRDAMVALGGRFFLFDSDARRPVAEVEPRTSAIRGSSLPDGLSPWPRDVTRHMGTALERGRERYGARVSRVVLLPPAELDAALLGALDARLRVDGLRPEEATLVDVAYELRGQRLHAEVMRVSLRDGTERHLTLVVDLSGTGSSS